MGMGYRIQTIGGEIMTYMKGVAQMFDVELNEQFRLRYADDKLSKSKYEFIETALVDSAGNPRPELLTQLLSGNVEVQKLPWTPQQNEVYWFVYPDGTVVNNRFDYHRCEDLCRYDLGMTYRTKSDAEANLEKDLKFYTAVQDRLNAKS